MARSHASSLCCPSCDYNLTGLTIARCPECGLPFDWNDLRQRARCTPALAFEKARGWRKPIGFVQTWFAVIPLPWVFAGQAVKSIRWPQGLLFAAFCYLGTGAIFFYGYVDGYEWRAWLPTAALCMLTEALALAALDFTHWHDLRKSFKFWLAVSGYTCAIMLTETTHGPPDWDVEDAWRLLRQVDTLLLKGYFPWAYPWGYAGSIIQFVQLFSWVLTLSTCFYFRLREGACGRTASLLASLAVAVALQFFYGLMFDIGYEVIYSRLDWWEWVISKIAATGRIS